MLAIKCHRTATALRLFLASRQILFQKTSRRYKIGLCAAAENRADPRCRAHPELVFVLHAPPLKRICNRTVRNAVQLTTPCPGIRNTPPSWPAMPTYGWLIAGDSRQIKTYSLDERLAILDVMLRTLRGRPSDFAQRRLGEVPSQGACESGST